MNKERPALHVIYLPRGMKYRASAMIPRIGSNTENTVVTAGFQLVVLASAICEMATGTTTPATSSPIASPTILFIPSSISISYSNIFDIHI